jgi:hypothetical protein
MTPEQIVGAVVLQPKDLARWAAQGVVVTDDNQLLAYGVHRHRRQRQDLALLRSNLEVVQRLAAGGGE